MNKNELIQKLIKGTIHRAISETTGCVVAMVVFAYFLQLQNAGTAKYYGLLLILIALGFIAGVIWAFTLSYKLLRTHPASDSAFWREAFMAQARLLRMVPLWYLGPLCPGILLGSAPTAPGHFAGFVTYLIVVLLVFGGVTLLTRFAAARMEKDSEAIAA